VNETNLCFTGGMPGNGLRELFGIWNEELDGISAEDRQSLCLTADNHLALNGQYNVLEFAERIHLEGATALAHYGLDFYAGEPALTVNTYGQGKAYYIAARTGDDFLIDFYRSVIARTKVKTTLPLTVPHGVHGTIRTDGDKQYLFVINWNQQAVVAPLDGQYRDLLKDQAVSNQIELPGFGSTVLEKI